MKTDEWVKAVSDERVVELVVDEVVKRDIATAELVHDRYKDLS